MLNPSKINPHCNIQARLTNYVGKMAFPGGHILSTITLPVFGAAEFHLTGSPQIDPYTCVICLQYNLTFHGDIQHMVISLLFGLQQQR